MICEKISSECECRAPHPYELKINLKENTYEWLLADC